MVAATGPVKVFGYAIVSADGMIADADGRMPPGLIHDADQVFYRTSLAAARVVLHGRNSGEGGPEAARRTRVIVTRKVDALVMLRTEPAILLWNPVAAPFAAVVKTLGLRDGVVAVVGGTDVFELFLGLGYDAFYLTRAAAVMLPGGRPVFRRVPAIAPERLLAKAGLKRRRERELAPDLTLSVWEPEPPE
ncbi:MAG: dihydrofolate reductase [Alphaproteobacteria bacterium]|nr:dihydrofolate reductase [Alphaproteobacteria bacterium]